MIKTKKILHLRRYLTLIVRSQLCSPLCETMGNRSPRRGGYVLDVHSRHASLRPEIYVATCNRMYSTECTTVLHSSPSDVDHKLTSFCENIKKGQVSADDLREIVNLCNKNDYLLPHSIGVLLLKCCRNLLSDLEAAKRNHLMNQVWSLAKKNGEALTLEYYNTLLGVKEENSELVNPKRFLSNMSVEPDENTYNLLLTATVKAGNSEYLWDILSIIKDKNITICEETISTLVQKCVTNSNINEFERIIMLMQEAKQFTTKAYTELACEYAKVGNIPNLVKILNEEPQSEANLLRIVKILSMSKNSRHIPVVLNFLMTSVPAIQHEISMLIAELIHADQIIDSYTIINYFAMNNVSKDIMQGFVNNFMNKLIMSNVSINDIIKYANNFVSSDCSKYALTDIAKIGLSLGRKKLCFATFQAMRNKNIEVRSHYYWPLLLKAYRDKGEAEIFSLLTSMMNEDVEIDSDTLIYYVFPYINTADPFITLKKLLNINVPNAVLCTSLLSFLLDQNRLYEGIAICSFCKHLNYKIYYNELINPLARSFLAIKDIKNCVLILMAFPQEFVSIFLKLILKLEPIDERNLQRVLEEFQIHEAKISQEEAIILKDKLTQNKNFNISAKLIDDLVDPNVKNPAFKTHLKYMNAKELTYLLIQLKSIKATKNIKNILYSLLVSYSTNNNFKKAEEIKHELDKCQYQWTPSMKAFLFNLYLMNDKLNEAEALLPDLHVLPDEVLLNRTKVVTYATALVKANQVKKAFNVIDIFNPVIETKTYAQIQCYTLLHTLAQSQHHIHTADMLDLLLIKNYCEKNIKLLTPLVAIPLIHNDVLGAVNVLTECTEKYGITPLALEVLTILLENRDLKLHNTNDYINRVYNIIATVYSPFATNTILAIALATLNKTKKLQDFLQNHKLSMNSLIYYINNIKTNRGIDGLQTLYKVINEENLVSQTLSNRFLSFYCQTGDCNRALKLWKIMCMKNIKPDKWFVKNFIQFLLSHKVPLPPELDRTKV